MNFDLIDIFSLFATIVTIGLVWNTIRENRRCKKEIESRKNGIEVIMSDYDRILASTRELEFEREKNSGEHFDDENIYLNRAQEIRQSTPFFQWVK